MLFIYTEHAIHKLKERLIDKKLVEFVLQNPDITVDSKFDRKIAQKFIEDKLLRVVFQKENNVYKIITAYYTKSKRYGE